VQVTAEELIQATPPGRSLLMEMCDRAAEGVSELWANRADSLSGLNELAGRLVIKALETGGETYKSMAPPHEPAAAGAGHFLFHRLAVLRFHRADAHAAAWQAAGLTVDKIRQMPPGPGRDAIEADTNRLAGDPFASLAPEERLGLLAGLAALRG
jgi:hypothetical protein